ncbi:MAG: DUF554 domain-containing protein [Spirochaetaceae bacterium]|jgi:uncharacterized membrane protein YqgA involved in biofilm formation|nr:DUF554 domain-containing protein [Spirochaetaceae bacterium]
MLGPVVNAVVIFLCSLLGAFVIRGAGARFEEIVKKALGLAVIYIGIKGALDNERPLLLIMSLVIGALLGELIGIDNLMNRAGALIERRLGTRTGILASSEGASFSKAFVSASILFCSGSMAIVGSMQSGLSGNHETLFAKSVLDGSISVIFGASLGIGTAFSAIPVLLYQGAIALTSMFVREYLSDTMIREMSAVGSLIIAAIGFNFLAIKEIKVANLILSVFIPLIYLSIEQVILS